MDPTRPTIHRASLAEVPLAFGLVAEYYRAAAVEVRERRPEFKRQYFRQGAGVWLAVIDGAAVGCVALRRLDGQPDCGEIKRMYVREAYRGNGIAHLLLGALEKYAAGCGYRWLYLDTAASMVRAARFYERNSYKPCERYNENPQATVFLRKQLTR